MVQLLHAVMVVTSLFLGLSGCSVNAQFEVFRGDEALRNLTLLSDLEKLAIAAKTGETHVLELNQEVQAAVVQEGVSLNIDCLPWLSQVDPDLDEYMIRWTFIQLDEFGNVEDPDQPLQELFRNDDVSPPPRVIVGGEFDRWLNITRTVIIQGAEDPDSRIYMCQVCRNITTLDDCSTSNYTQLTVGSSPIVVDSSVIQCVSRDADDKVVNLDCEIMNDPQPSPRRTWFKDGEQVYSAISGFTPDPSEFVMMNPILMPGVLDPITFSTLSDGSIVYNYEVENITSPQLLPPNTTTIEEAEQQVFELLLGNWTCMVSNTLGSATITYVITDCDAPPVPQFNITTGDITVNEDAGEVEVCVTSDVSVTREITIAAETQSKEGAIAQATAGLDYAITAFELTFTPEDASTTQCAKVTIIDDEDPEPLEQFSVKLLSASPEGTFVQDTYCISIIDNDVIDDGRGGNISFERETYTVSEDDGYVEVCIVSFNLTGMIEVEITSPDVKEVDNPAFEVDDFSYNGLNDSGITVFFDTSTSSQACINISIVGDRIFEGDEQFLVMFGNLPNAEAGVGPIEQACVTIVDDDVPEFIISPPTKTVFENESVEICITRSMIVLGRPVTVTAQTGPKIEAANQATADLDYESRVFNLTFEPLDENITRTLCTNIQILEDLISDEPDEEFSVTIIDATPGTTFNSQNTSCITIIDNTAPSVPQFFIVPREIVVNESVGEVEVCVRSDIPVSTETLVVGETGPKDGAVNQATAGADYMRSGLMWRFLPTDDVLIQCRRVGIINDTIEEPTEEFSVKLTSVSPAGTIVNDTSCISILDNDQPVPQFTIRPREINVKESVGEVELCVTSDIPVSTETLVVGQTQSKDGAANQATAGADYMSSQFMLRFQPSDDIQTKCTKVGIIGDTVVEPTEQFSVKLTSASPEGTFIQDTSCISIVDDDQQLPPVPKCHKNAIRVNKYGHLVCFCKRGYHGDGIRHCDDIDECYLWKHNCHWHATCLNTNGSFTCTCNEGYTGNGIYCEDINECETGEDNCDPLNGICVNNPGSFSCSCNEGFEGDGVNCVSSIDVNMCDKSGTRRTRTKTRKSHSKSTGAGSPGPCDIDDDESTESTGTSTTRTGTTRTGTTRTGTTRTGTTRTGTTRTGTTRTGTTRTGTTRTGTTRTGTTRTQTPGQTTQDVPSAAPDSTPGRSKSPKTPSADPDEDSPTSSRSRTHTSSRSRVSGTPVSDPAEEESTSTSSSTSTRHTHTRSRSRVNDTPVSDPAEEESTSTSSSTSSSTSTKSKTPKSRKSPKTPKTKSHKKG